MAKSSDEVSEAILQPKYPEHLLNASGPDRLAYFRRKDLIVDHPNLRNTLAHVRSAADPGLDQSMVYLIGPTGVGKTALLILVVRQIIEEFASRMTEDRFLLPAIQVEAEAPEKGQFDWTEFYISVLLELRVPLIESTLPAIERNAGLATIRTTAPELREKIPRPGILRRRVKNVLRQRLTVLFGIDEAFAMLNVRNHRSEAARRESIKSNAAVVKSLVNKSLATLVFAGAFDFFDLAIYTGQLARRSQIVHFPDYTECIDDIAGYTEGLLGLLSHVPGHIEVDPTDIAADCLVQSVGAIGTTRTILYRWLKRSIDFSEPLDKKTLHSCFYPKAALDVMRQEAKDGRARVLDFLKRDEFEQSPPNSQPSQPPNSGESSKPPIGQRLKPGETKPSRRWLEGSQE
jgi:hypothetical protein